MTMLNLKLGSTDNGNCRVYYRSGKSLYAFQEDRHGTFTLYVCSREGEPSHESTAEYELDRLPEPEDSTSRSFRKWRGVDHA